VHPAVADRVNDERRAPPRRPSFLSSTVTLP